MEERTFYKGDKTGKVEKKYSLEKNIFSFLHVIFSMYKKNSKNHKFRSYIYNLPNCPADVERIFENHVAHSSQNFIRVSLMVF